MYTSLVNLQHSDKNHHPDGTEPRESQSVIMSSSQRMNSSRRHSRISHSSSAGSISASHSSEGDKVSPEKKQPVPSFWRLAALNLPEWKQAIVACISAILFGAVQPVYSFAAGSMIWVFFLRDHDEMKDKIRFYSLAFLGLAIFSLAINISQHYSFAYMGEHLTKRIREKMLAKVLTFEVGWFDEDENSSGSICSRLSKDASIIRSLVGDRTSLIIQTVSAIGFAFSISLAVTWRFSIVIIACQPVIIICIYVRRVLLKSISKKAVKAQGESSKLAAEAVTNHRTITAFSSQDRILAMLERTHDAPRRESIRQSWYAGVGLGISQFMTKCILAFSFWYAGKLITEGHVTPKAFFETLFVLLSTGRVIADAGSMTSDLTKGAETVTSVFNILDRTTKIEPEEPESYEPKTISGLVEFRDIDFAYPARPDTLILKGFSFMLEAGKSTALVGQSGSGKSTLVGLIERYYDPINGAIYIDGRDLQMYKLRSLRKHISLVSQEPTLFAGTIRENIRYGMPEAQEAEIVEAAKVANAHDFIVGLKDGYDTSCGDKGVQLSGGQKQRVAIARAVLRNPSLLLLDEATSALDTRSEQVVQNALERLMVGRTSLVIAHRLTTIQKCDVIAVLDQGKVVEKGTHSSLLAKGPTGAYYLLVNLQTTPTGGS
ncbi:hypothetical protein MLD38_001487 [Melastoma candidum]|uniref:Uncharacterized protein n=1 Tax=Melastoma candidum TaxID=119954 RepID=A0ACB9SHC4_9MYRT|nr:hypothetical protein MLD38_001487 [Melastoma candidum]